MRNVELTAITDQDFGLLCSWRNTPEFLALCTQQTCTVTAEEFRKELEACFWRDRHWQSIVRVRGDAPLGTIFSYDYSKRDKYCFVTIYLAHRHPIGAGVYAVLTFTRALFQELSLHKIYFDVHAYNCAVTSMLQRAGLVLEGHFKGHRLHNGVRHDTFRYALYPDALQRFPNSKCPYPAA